MINNYVQEEDPCYWEHYIVDIGSANINPLNKGEKNDKTNNGDIISDIVAEVYRI